MTIDTKAIRAAADFCEMRGMVVELDPSAVIALLDRLEAAEAEVLEQARLLGIGGEKELALMAKLEAAEKDAARYRWIRHGDNDESVLCSDCRGIYLPRNERLDEAIDHWLELDRMTTYLTQDPVLYGAAMKERK